MSFDCFFYLLLENIENIEFVQNAESALLKSYDRSSIIHPLLSEHLLQSYSEIFT